MKLRRALRATIHRPACTYSHTDTVRKVGQTQYAGENNPSAAANNVKQADTAESIGAIAVQEPLGPRTHIFLIISRNGCGSASAVKHPVFLVWDVNSRVVTS
jgi:hypothetical protein